MLTRPTARRFGRSTLENSTVLGLALLASVLCLLVFSNAAQANVSPTITATYPTSQQAEAHSNYRHQMAFTYSGTDDLRNLAIDFPAGLVGNPNAIPTAQRCNVDYTGAVGGGGSPNYAGCPASSQVGTISVGVNSSVCGNLTLSGKIWLLNNRPSATPEVPTHLGITVSGSACLILTATVSMTAEITLRDNDAGLRIRIFDDISRTDPIIGGAIKINTIDETINGIAPNGVPFLTNPTRCDTWTTNAYARAWDTNTNTTDTFNGISWVKSPNANLAPTCTALAAYNPGFTIATSNTQAGAPTAITATMTNTIPNTNIPQPAYTKRVDLTFPTGYEINPAIANKVGSVGCTDAQFDEPVPGAVPTCPAASQIGTVSISTPLITGAVTGKLFLGSPGPSGTGTDRYRLFVYANNGAAVKFEGRATVAADGTVTTTFGDPSYDKSLPQFPYTTFVLNFDTGVAAEQMITNPQVCGTYNTSTTLTPWTNPTQATVNRSSALSVTAGANGSCNFDAFNPGFTANLSDTGAAKHPDMTLTVTRGDRQDNLKDMTFTLPNGLSGALTAAPVCSAANAAAGTCAAGSEVGTVAVLAGTGAETITLNGKIFLTDPDVGDIGKLAIVVPAIVGPFDLGNVVIYSRLQANSSTTFGLTAITQNMPQMTQGIPVRYRSIALTLNGIIGAGASAKPFLQNPSICGVDTFQATIGSAGAAPAAGVSNVVKTDTDQSTTGCAAGNPPFNPSLAVTPTTTETAKPTGETFTVSIPQTTTGVTTATVQNSTLKRVQLTMPVGMEINPGFTNSLTACATATIDAGGSGCAATSKIGTLSVNTPLLTAAQPGDLFLETPGATAATRYKLGLVIHLPGRDMVVHGSAQVNGSTDLATGMGSVNTGTGQVTADFPGLPDVAIASMALTFTTGPNAMFTNPAACGSQTFNSTMTPNNASGATASPTAAYTTTYDGAAAACPGSDPWSVGNAKPSFAQTVSTTVANAHPDLTLTVQRQDKDQLLRDITYGLPPGLTGAPANVPTCPQANANLGSCLAATQIGTVSVSIGSGTSPLTVNGTLHNTVSPATQPAKFTAVVPVLAGPFNLGKLSIPVNLTMRSDYGLDATVANLPQRYEGVPVRYQSMQIVVNGVVGGQTFLTNPSKCGVNTTNTAMTSTLNNTVARTATYTTTGCPINFGTAPTFSAVPSTVLAQVPTGYTITVGSAATNPTIKRIQVAFPVGTEINPAVGNGPLTACATATIDAGGAACPATSNQGTVSITTPLLTGTFTGNVYLETPGATAATRYKLAIVVHLPGRDMIIHGGATVNGSTDVTPATGTGSIDSGTGQVTADFNNIPDLAFSSMTLTLASGNRALLINPTTCAAQVVNGTITPNSGGAATTPTSGFTTTTNCGTPFTPTFTGSVSSTTSGGHPNLTLGVTSPDRDLQLRNFNVHLPTGLVANTTATARCTQANATLGNCVAANAVGTVATSIGNGGESYALSGTIYNVDANPTEPARLSVMIPVAVGPFDLGKLTIPVSTSLRADYGVDANTQLPLRYEGIAVRIRSLSMVLNGVVSGQNFITNPSKCQSNTVNADMISPTPTTVTGSFSYTTTGCPVNFGTAPTLTVTPSTTASQTPVGLTIGVNSAATNPTVKRIQLAMPTGMEINPAFGNGPLAACPTATIDAGGAACPATSNVGTVNLTTPLLPLAQAGSVYLETPGATAATRYKLAIVIHLPGRDMVVHGSVQVNGSTTISAGATGAVDSGTGQVTADFDNIPDLGFTNMTLAFASGNRAMLINPTTCAAQTFNSTITPNSGGADAAPTANYTTTSCASTFTPSFTGSVSTTVANGHPNLTLTATSPDKDLQLRNFNLHLPTGLVASTTATTQCAQATAAAGNCTAAQIVGSVSTSIGNGGESYALSGSIYNVAPNLNEPARLSVMMPVVVGPFDLGKLTIPVGTSLRADFGVDTTTQLPLRYEGIAVRIRSMQLVLNGVVGGNNFMTNPSKCQSNTVSADMVSSAAGTVTGTFSFTTTGCPVNYGTAPSITVTPSTTAAQTPVGLTIGVNTAASNPTTKRVQLAMPAGMEINPAFGNGPLAACATATIDAGGAGCPATSNVGTVSLTTPLLATVQTGNVYLETPGATAATRYKLAIVIHLPSADLVVHGSVQVNGSTNAAGATGAVDSGTGQVTADFDNIPDLGFTNLTLALNSGNRAMLINPTTCVAQTFNATLTPNSGAAAATPSAAYTPTLCTNTFAPTFTGSVSTTAANGHPNLTLSVTSPDKDLQLRNFNVHLPTGLVASTTATVPCAQAVAGAGNCTAGQAVGTVATSIGNGGESYALSGTIYNVTPNPTEPARLSAMIPVAVGPFDLGKLTIPVSTALRADLGVDANTQLPVRYEGIAVRIRSMSMVLNGVVGGNNFMTNPSKCQSNTVNADMISPTPTTVTGNFSFTTTGCPINYGTAPTLTVTPSTTVAQTPVGLTIGVNSAATNVTTKRIQLAMPAGMEVNPAFGNGPLTACATATIDAGGAGCPATSQVGTVSLTTPLLSAAQSGFVYLETPGATAATRYKLAIVVHLPGRDLVVHGSVQVNGSTNAVGATGAVDSGTGQVTADFDNIPDLGFTNMTLALNSGNRAMLINPTTCVAQTFNATLTPNSGGVDATPSAGYTPTTCASTFAPAFSGSVSTTAANGHPNVTLTATSPDKDLQLRNFNLHLPTGLVANTTATTPCLQAVAAAGNCTAAQLVGSVNTSIGNGGESYALSGSVYNVTPNGGEPARFSVMIPVVVGPFDLGKLTIPVGTSLRPDLGVDTTTQLPLRYEGIAVRIRSLSLVLNGVANGNNFMTNPSKCQSNTVSADMISSAAGTVTGTFNYTTTGCPINYGTPPTLTVTPSTTVAQTPVGLTIGVNSAATNPTTKRIQLAMPAGMEINPGFGNGPLAACAPATVDAGGAGCPATSQVGTVNLSTPLLPTVQNGFVYLETPGTTATTRYKLAIVVHLPGRDLVVRGAVQVNGSTTISAGATGAVDSGTGQITADFDNIVDLAFTNMTLAFNSSPHAMLINPTTCAAQNFNATLTPNSGGVDATPTTNYTTTACTNTFAPTFTASVSTTAANGHPNLTLGVTSPDKDLQLRNFNVHLPTGLVAATTAVGQCSQANAAAANCLPAQAVGSVTASIGNGGDNLSLNPGTIYNVFPNPTEPARLEAVIPVVVGPFDLGNLAIPVSTALRADLGVDANTQLPVRYEGIAVRIRSMSMVLNGVVGGNNFMTNPSKCQSNTIGADMISTTPTTVTGTSSFTTTGCPINYGTAPTLTVTPSTTVAQTPVGLTIGVNSATTNVTTKRIQLAMPTGMEVNPAFGNGPLAACATATIDAGGAACPATSQVGTVSLTTPLLSAAQSGFVYLETPGATAATRYKLAIVVHLPGRDLVVHGSVQVNGSTNAVGATGSVDSGTGQVTADFDNIPDLGFTNMTLALNSGNRAMLINPTTCVAQTFIATLTPNSGGVDATPTANYSTTGCTNNFAPSFTGSVSTTTAGGHPNLTLTATSPDKDLQLRNFNVHLPTGLVANTTATVPCAQAIAAAGNCLANQAVGSVTTSIGNGGESYALSGTIYNVTPNLNEPARLSAMIPVVVGPFDLGKLTIPVGTSLRADLGVDTTTQLPLRYEGIAVRIRSMSLVLNGVANGNSFMTNPSKCQGNTVSADMISPTPTTVTGSFNYTTNGCPLGFGTAPTLSVTPSTFASQTPVGLTVAVNSAATNPSIKRVQLAMPVGMEINPGFGNGPLAACAQATVDAGGAGCPATSQVGTVSLTTPLLSAVQNGFVYLETPGATAATRYKLAIVIHLPGRDVIVRGAVGVSGTTTISAGATGAVDSGTGQVTADFDNIPDLGFTNMTLAFNSSPHAMLINPTTCAAQTFNGTVTPNSGGADATPTANYTTTTCASTFTPTFTASVSSTVAGAHPNLTLGVTSPDKDLQLRNFNVHLPTGLVAATTATTPTCPQATAAAGNCTAAQAIGTVSTSIGNGGDNYALNGSIYNVDPNSNEPARLSVMIPVVVGPFDLGKLTIPVGTSLRPDLGVDANTQLPLRYEGIAVRIRSLSLVLNGVVGGSNFITNPSKCQSNTISGDMISTTPTTVTGTSSFTTTGCPINYGTAPTISVTPSTTVAQTPVGLTIGVNSAATNVTTKRIQLAMPAGMEVNPAFGNGPLTACATATIDAGGAACPATSQVGTVSLTSALLSAGQSGFVYLETPGNTAATRYKLAIVVHLPGRDLVVHGSVQVNGSTDVTPATGTGSIDSGTGQVTADFNNIPDLAFTNMTLVLNSGNRAMLINPTTCAAQTFNGTLTPNSGGADATPTANYTTTACTNSFAPSFTGSVSTTAAGGHPNLTLGFTSPDKDLQLRNFNVHLPTGLVANTTAATPACPQATATAGGCTAAQAVGTVSTSIGNGGETYALNGTIYNVVPNLNEPARLQVVVPVAVGPFDLGKLSIPVGTSLRSDFGVDANAQLPVRYEGIAVRIRSMSMVLNGVVGGNNFITNPSKCQNNTVNADMISPTPTTVTGAFSYTTTGCPAGFGTTPAFAVTPSTTETQKPVGLTFQVISAATNPTISRIQMLLPPGMEINPAFGNSLLACSTAQIDSGGSLCPASSNVGTVNLTTPLLTAVQTGNVYLETPGTTAGTRYKLAIVIHLPGRDMVVRGAVNINGSTTIPGGGTGAVDSGTGQISADFNGIPDLQFTNLTIAFNAGNRAMLTNPNTCVSHTFNATVTPSSGGADATPNAAYTATANCGTTFAPTFSASVNSTVAGGHPDLTLTVNRPEKDLRLRNFNLHLPTGLVAATTATGTTCTQANAALANCAAGQVVGAVTTAIGTGGETLPLAGSIYNVTPNSNEPARLAAIIPVFVGPFDLGKLSIPVTTSMRADYGIDANTQLPLRFEGIMVRISQMQLVLNGTVSGNPFITNPSKCQGNTISADMISETLSSVSGSSNYTTTGCPINFGTPPTITAAVSPSETVKPTGLTLGVNSAATNPTINRVQMTLPAGMEINPSVGNGLLACSTANIDAGGGSCPASSNLGSVSLTTSLLPAVQTGAIYLETPGNTAATRYKLGVVVHLPGKDLVVHGKALVNGSSDVVAGTGTGSVDSGTGQVTADFPNIPDLGFTNMTIAFNTGTKALLSNPSTCGAQTVGSTITPSSGGADATPSTTFSTSFDGAGAACPGAAAFAPTFSASLSNSASNAHPNLTLTVTGNEKDRQLRNLSIHLPTGLVAATTATPQCSQANAALANCAAGQIVGSVTTAIGTGTVGTDTLGLSGSIYNVAPNANEPARLAAIMPVVVGPFDLGKLSIPVSTALRTDYGVDANAQLPTRYEGILVRVRSVGMVLNGTVGANSFITNPSKCGSSTISADMTPLTGSPVTGSSPINITGCPIGFGTAPTLSASVTPSETAKPTGLSLTVNSAATNPTVKRIQMALPNGMSINPSVGNGLLACSTLTIDAGGAACPAASQMGTVSLTTPLLAAPQTGKVFLETPGNTAATRYKMAIVVNLPGQTMIVHGSAQVNGSSDLVGGTGAVDSGTGNVTADFDGIPDLGFTALTINFNTGDDALLTNPETCGAQTVNSTITPNSAPTGADATPSANFSTSYDGAGAPCPGAEGFTPTATASLSTTQAAGNPDLTLQVDRNDKNQQLHEFDVQLPPGLVADTVHTPRCTQANAAAGTCAVGTVVGSVSTKIGTGNDTLSLAGTINNTDPDPSEPARLTAIMPVVVGPYDLGKLSIPVKTTLVGGALPSDLRIDAKTFMPDRYEGVPVRVRQLKIVVNGIVNGNGFMINPSSCAHPNTINTVMKSTTATTAPGTPYTFTATGCNLAQFNPTLGANVSTTKSGMPAGLSLAFNIPSNSSSVNQIKTTLPAGMQINPAFGNGLVACSTATINLGYPTDGAANTGCPAASVMGTVTLDTPLLPTQQHGVVVLETPGTTAATRYKLAIIIDLPGPDLIVHGQATVDGSSDLPGPTGNSPGAVDTGTGQVTAEFDALPDIQFSKLAVNFNTGDDALLTNPETCGAQTVSADLKPWSDTSITKTATDSFTTSYDGAGAACPGTIPQNPSLSATLGTNALTPSAYVAGAHADVTMTVSRPDGDQGIRRVKILLPNGLVGSAAAAPTCLQVDADAGNCPAASQVGDVTLNVGSGNDTYQLNGTINNTVAPSNRPAKLTFSASVDVGPFHLGKVIVPIDINLDPNDYSLSAETGVMPQVYEGVPVRIRQLTMHLDGYAKQGTLSTADDKPFMSNPRTCAATAPTVRADITSPINYPNNVAQVSGQLPQAITGCGSLNLDDDAISVVNTPTDAEKPTKLGVQVDQGTTPNQATLKDFTIALPGFRLNAPAADGLVACSAAQLDAQTCPANSKVGKAWLDTSLLPIDVPDPDAVDPTLHSLWGNVYLETPGTLADGSDRYKLAIQLTGKTVITIRGVAKVNETTGDITTQFTGLPDIPFEHFNVQLNGATNPLLLNPSTCGTSTAASALTPWAGAVKNINSALSVTNCTSHPFTPSVAVNLTTYAAGTHPDAEFTISRADNDQDLKSVNMSLPAGFLGSAASVPACSLANAAAGNCSSSSAVGTVVAKIGQNGETLTLPGTAYLTDGANGDIAGMSIKIPAIAGPYNLGDYITQGRIVLRPSDHGIDVFFDNIPQLFKGVPTKMQELKIDLPGISSSNKPFLYNASSCDPMNITGTMTSYNSTTATNNVLYKATNCLARQFTPTMSFEASGGNFTVAPSWTIKMGVGDGNSTMKYTKVLLPTIMTVNVQGLGTICEPAEAAAHACPAATSIGDVTISTPLLPAPVTGTVYVARTLTGSTLPDLLIEIPAPINMQIRGANSFINNIQIQSTFDNLPDLVWSDMTMHINGGPKGLLGLRSNGKCGSASTSFASHSGQTMAGDSPVTGITNCANQDTVCNTPTVVTSTKGGVKKKGNKKLKTALTFSSEAACPGIKSFSVLYPKGTKINKKLLLFNKKKKATKKNLKNLTGKAGSLSLKSTDFQVTGKNGIKIKTALPADVHQISINSQLSSVLLPYKTYCGGIKGKGRTLKAKLKKCRAKPVTYTFVVTRTDGSVLRYDYKVAAGDKKFK